MINTRNRFRTENDPDMLNWNTITRQRLVDAFLTLRTPDHVRSFLDDLLTTNELDTCARRLDAANWMLLGAPYEAITEATGLSPKVIARISKRLVNKRGGFNQVMQRLHPRGMHYTE